MSDNQELTNIINYEKEIINIIHKKLVEDKQPKKYDFKGLGFKPTEVPIVLNTTYNKDNYRIIIFENDTDYYLLGYNLSNYYDIHNYLTELTSKSDNISNNYNHFRKLKYNKVNDNLKSKTKDYINNNYEYYLTKYQDYISLKNKLEKELNSRKDKNSFFRSHFKIKEDEFISKYNENINKLLTDNQENRQGLLDELILYRIFLGNTKYNNKLEVNDYVITHDNKIGNVIEILTNDMSRLNLLFSFNSKLNEHSITVENKNLFSLKSINQYLLSINNNKFIVQKDNPNEQFITKTISKEKEDIIKTQFTNLGIDFDMVNKISDNIKNPKIKKANTKVLKNVDLNALIINEELSKEIKEGFEETAYISVYDEDVDYDVFIIESDMYNESYQSIKRPGEMNGESLINPEINNYSYYGNKTNWRKSLSDSCILETPIKIINPYNKEELLFWSVNHALGFFIFKKESLMMNPKFNNLFINNKTPVNFNYKNKDSINKFANENQLRLIENINQKNKHTEADLTENNHIHKCILIRKFLNNDLIELLTNTKESKLIEVYNREKIILNDLMEIRQILLVGEYDKSGKLIHFLQNYEPDDEDEDILYKYKELYNYIDSKLTENDKWLITEEPEEPREVTELVNNKGDIIEHLFTKYKFDIFGRNTETFNHFWESLDKVEQENFFNNILIDDYKNQTLQEEQEKWAVFIAEKMEEEGSLPDSLLSKIVNDEEEDVKEEDDDVEVHSPEQLGLNIFEEDIKRGGFTVNHITPDGNCMYYAIIDQFNENNLLDNYDLSHRTIQQTANYEASITRNIFWDATKQLRERLSLKISDLKDDTKQDLICNNANRKDKNDCNKYITDIGKMDSGLWGGEDELAIISIMFNVIIKVYSSSDTQPTIYNAYDIDTNIIPHVLKNELKEYNKEQLSTEINLGYIGLNTSHYVSLTKNIEPDYDDDIEDI